MSATPEFSRDGKLVLFLSEAPNLTTNALARGVVNLYMANLQTHAATLLSVGVDGKPANDAIVNFELSADNNRVMLETAASNMVANDTNKTRDVFVRDLSSGQSYLISANTNGAVARKGGFNGSMSADGKFVTFMSSDTALVAEKSLAFWRVFVRDIAAGITQAAPTPNTNNISYAQNPSISGDGKHVSFTASYSSSSPSYTSWDTNLIWNVQTAVSTPMSDIPTSAGLQQGRLSDTVMTPDGKFVAFQIRVGFSPLTNYLARYSVETGATDFLVTNNVPWDLAPLAISADGGTILYFQNGSFNVYRDNAEARIFPHAPDETPIPLNTRYSGDGSMSADGRFVAFTTDLPLLPGETTPQYRTYVYDVESDQLIASPISWARGGPSDPVLNPDGSIIVFSAAEPGIQDESEPLTQNIYAWNRLTGAVDLISASHATAFENSSRGDSKLYETGAISEDGMKVVFASRAPSRDITDTNGTWDIFVLDRKTGRQELVSVSMDGSSSGSHPSIRPIISGDGRVVAFFSRATNLVSTTTPGTEQLYVRELDRGLTHLVANANGEPANARHVRESLTFSYDGNRLVFASGAANLDPRPGFPPQIFLYDLSSNKASLLSYNSTKTSGATGFLTDPAISRDGLFVAFHTTSSTSFGLPSGKPVVVRTIDTGAVRGAPTPLTSGSTSWPQTVRFNRDSTALYYGAPTNFFVKWDLATSNSYTALATNCIQASVSQDDHWVAFTRRTSTFPLKTEVYLRDTTTGIETLLSTNTAAGVAANGNSSTAKITGDGRFVAFKTRAANLIPNDSNGTADILLFDRERAELRALSANANTAAGNSASLRPVISPDDSYIAFMSFASDLYTHDYNEGSDIFLAYLPGPDTDSDNIDDRWEMAAFGSLTHNMSGDADGDGLSDFEEFEAGTDPLLATSALKVTRAAFNGSGNVELEWSGAPGRAYRIQARARFDATDAWRDITDAILSGAATSSIELPAPNGNEFYYRIVSAD